MHIYNKNKFGKKTKGGGPKNNTTYIIILLSNLNSNLHNCLVGS